MKARPTEQARQFLDTHRFGVLATINKDGTPQQSTVWYELQGNEILMNTRLGRLEDRNLRRDPRCSICVEHQYTYVAIIGTSTLINDQQIAQEDVRRLTILNHGEERGEQQYRDVFAKQERVTIRLAVERVDEYGLK